MYLAPVQPPRQRLPQRVYAARRAIAGIVIAAVLFLIYSIVTAVFAGPSPSTEAAPTAPSTSLVVSGGPAVALTSSPTSPSTSTTELKPKEKSVPTSANPAALYVAGDSDAARSPPTSTSS